MRSRPQRRILAISVIATVFAAPALLHASASHAATAVRTFRRPPVLTRQYAPPVTITGAPALSANVDASNESGPQSETTIAASPVVSTSLVAGANDIGANLLAVAAFSSRDGGQTWSRTAIPYSQAGCGSHGGGIAGDPALGVSLSGEYFYSFISFCNDGTGEVDVAHSTDGGVTWTRVAAFPNVAAGYGPDKDQIAVDDNVGSPTRGRVYVSWDENFPNGTQRAVLVWSDDRGLTWHKPVAVDVHGSGGVIYATPAVGPDGRVYVIWNDYGISPAGRFSLIKFAAAANTPATGYVPTFTSNKTLAVTGINLFLPGPFAIPAQPDRGIAADPSLSVDSTGRLYALWTQGVRGSAVTNVECQTSTDGGQTWSKAVQVNDDNTPGNFSSGASDFFPWGAIDRASGAFHVSFYSTRLDASNQTTNVYVAVSTDGGVSFSPNTRITTIASNESVTNPQRDTGNNYGDYEGLVMQAGKEHPVWTDTRKISTAGEEVFTASH